MRTVVSNYLSVFDPTITVPDPSEDIAADIETPFAQRVRAMDPDSFVTCISLCCEEVQRVLARSTKVTSFLQAILSTPVVNGESKNGDPESNGHASR